MPVQRADAALVVWVTRSSETALHEEPHPPPYHPQNFMPSAHVTARAQNTSARWITISTAKVQTARTSTAHERIRRRPSSVWYTLGASDCVSFVAVWLLPWHEMA
jgi:hypothetical protein